MTMRTVFFGTSEFAVPALRLLAARTTCALVVTQPDRPSGRGQRVRPTPVKAAAIDLGIPTCEPARLRDAVAEIAATNAELFVLASYGKIVPQTVLDLPRLGALNIHPSLLPRYRGATPLQSQLRDGVHESGVSLIFMDAGLDTGDVALRRGATIDASETYGELHDRFADIGASLLAEALDRLAGGSLERTSQRAFGTDAEAAATMTAPYAKDDLRLFAYAARLNAGDPTRPTARDLVDLIRSLAPARIAGSGVTAPAARLDALPAASDAASAEPALGPVKIFAAHAAAGPDLVADRVALGTAVVVCGEIYVRATDGWIRVDALTLPGRKPMLAEVYRLEHRSLIGPIQMHEDLLTWHQSRHPAAVAR